MELKSEYFKQIHHALLDAFPTLAYLQLMARNELNLNLNVVVTHKGTYQTLVKDLIGWAESHDRVEELIAGARKENPTNKKLEAAEEKLLSAGKDAYILSDDVAPITEDVGADKNYPDKKTGLEMIYIKAGDFDYGKEGVYSLPEFWISKTPVTNAHYLRFAIKTRHGSPKHWEVQSRDDAQEILNHPVVNISRDDEAYDDWAGIALPNKGILNHPVVCVSWNDAKVYVDWAGMKLPTEQEWEKAARGTKGRIYPWGYEWRDGRCNTKEAGIGETTPVDKYTREGASGASFYGCWDMAGNVWEWTASWYDGKQEERVKRGGSFNRDQYLARAASRHSDPPDTLLNHLGFRVVRCPSSQ